MRVAYVYPNPRAQLAVDVAVGEAPDTALLGQNHLGQHGIEARIHQPRARRRHRAGGVAHRVTWHARELLLPFELRGVDAALTPLANLFPLLARAARRPPVVLFDWGLETALARGSRARRRLVAESVRSATVVACPSEAQRRHLVSTHGFDERRIELVELGADADYFRPAEADRGYVLAVGKDLARDYRTLFEAARAGGWPTVVVALDRNVAGLERPGNVRLQQGLEWHELRDLYDGATCVVLPLRESAAAVGTDGSGLTAALEAMASGKAIVATRRPALETYLTDGVSVDFVSPEDPAALAEAIGRLVADDARRSELGRAARRAVEERFSTPALADRLARVLRHVAQHR